MTVAAPMLNRLLHEQIPIAAQMGVTVACFEPQRLVLAVPLAPNINHEGTVFGGTLYSAAAAAGWGLLHMTLEAHEQPGHIVIYRGEIDYRRPVTGDFEIACTLPGDAELDGFLARLRERARARLTLVSEVVGGAEPAVTFTGHYAVREA